MLMLVTGFGGWHVPRLSAALGAGAGSGSGEEVVHDQSHQCGTARQQQQESHGTVVRVVHSERLTSLTAIAGRGHDRGEDSSSASPDRPPLCRGRTRLRRPGWGSYLQMILPEVPSSMVIVTVEPGATVAPAPGLWPITCPGSRHCAVCSMWATSPAAVSSLMAWAVVSPVRSGTVTAPREMVRSTGEPTGSLVPAGEFEAITVPALAGSTTVVTVPTVRPRPARRLAAVPWSAPIRGGTVLTGAVERTMTLALVAERKPKTEPESILTALPKTQVTTMCRTNRRDPPQVGEIATFIGP